MVKRHFDRETLLCILAFNLAWTSWCIGAAPGHAPERYTLSIARQPLEKALPEFARQSGIQIVFFSGITAGLESPRLDGQYALAEALNTLLADSPLTFRIVNSRTVEIRARSETSPAEARAPPDPEKEETSRTDGKRHLRNDSARPVEAQEVVIQGTSAALVATRIETPLREIPQTISIIPREQIRQQNDTGLDEALAHATGITSVQDNSLNESFFSRGFQVTSLHIDGGAPLNALDPVSNPFFGTPDLSEFDRVEVLRGADALFGGDGNPGATINMVRKRPLHAPELDVTAWSGSYQNYRAEVDVTGPLALDGALRGRFDAVYGSRDFFYDTASQKRKKVFAVLEYDIAPKTLLTLGGSYQWDDAVPWISGLPRYPDGSDPHLPRHTSLAFDWARYHTRIREAYFRLEHEFNTGWKLQMGATSLRSTAEFGYAQIRSAIDPATNGLVSPASASYSVSPNVEDQLAFDATLTGAFQALGRRVELAMGGDYRHFKGRTSEATIFGFGPLVSDVFAYDPALYPNPRSTPLRGPQLDLSSTNQSGLFASTKVYLDAAWSITAGARVSRNSFYTDNFVGSGDEELTPGSSQAFSSSGKITPYAGVVYTFNPRYSLYASYADIYQSVGHYLRRSGELLRPTDGVVIETGIKGAWRDGLLNGSLAVYRVRQYGLPVYDMNAPPDSLLTTGCCFLPGAARASKGVDAELSGTFAPGWLLGAGYTFNNNQSDREAPQLSAETPRHLMKIWISGQLPGDLRRFTLGGTLHAQSANSKTGVDICPFNRFPCAPRLIVRDEQRSYAVLDLRIGYQIDSHWQAALTIGNLFDRTYLQTVGIPEGDNWYGEPRTFLFRLDGRY